MALVDPAPTAGQNQYRVVNVGIDGGANESEVIEVNYFKPEGLSWGAVGPNPASEVLNISFYSPSAGAVDLQMLDLSGRLVMARELIVVNGGNSQTIDLSSLNRGQYYLSLRQGSEKLIRKIAKL